MELSRRKARFERQQQNKVAVECRCGCGPAAVMYGAVVPWSSLRLALMTVRRLCSSVRLYIQVDLLLAAHLIVVLISVSAQSWLLMLQ
jgi:hypothetical protein